MEDNKDIILDIIKRKARSSIEYANHMILPKTLIHKNDVLKSFVDLILYVFRRR